jgi:hypothetical protein
MTRGLFRVLALGALAAAAACSDSANSNPPTGPSNEPDARQAPGGPAAAQASEDDPIALAGGVAGFGGFFVDEQGRPTVFLTDLGRRGDVAAALGPWFRARGRSAAELQVRKAEFAWSDLEKWFTQASPEVLAIQGAVFADADEGTNRVRIGVEHAAAAGQVRSALARLGIPPAAVTIEQTEPIVQLATLQSRIRPIVAGLQINFPGFLCSIGFNATRSGTAGFVTASHCTTKQGGVESTPYWQPLQSVDGTQIATETVDPSYTSGGGCPSGRVCRQSDAAFAAYTSAITGTNGFTLGRIAQTSSTSKRDLTVVGNYTVTSDASGSTFVVGEVVNKVGRTTGWSQGKVTQSCVNVNVSGSSVTQLCQTIVSATVGSGDSGSDVFTITSGTNVKLDGVLWGGSSNGRTFVFSPLANVQAELGSLTTH